jgi:hypothetical protein
VWGDLAGNGDREWEVPYISDERYKNLKTSNWLSHFEEYG